MYVGDCPEWEEDKAEEMWDWCPVVVMRMRNCILLV